MNLAGKVRNFRLYNITSDLQPVLVRIIKSEDMHWLWNILVEVQGDPKEAYQQVKRVYEEIVQLDFKGEYFDHAITQSFASQRRTSKIVLLFSFIAIVISLLGLLAISTYFIQQRSREVAVRKVFGSTNAQILTKLIRTFLNYVLIAFVLATPIVWYIMNRWLSDYSYRISLSPWIFIGAGLFCLVISFLAVFWQSHKAANTNPVESVKAE